MYYDIISVKHLENYKLEVIFETGEKGIIDLANIEKKGVFKRFEDINYFKKAYIHEGVLTWAPGDIDIAPETVYFLATGKTETHPVFSK